MDYDDLVKLLYRQPKYTAAQVLEMYPPRSLPEGAKVTRFAPSPTGFVHFGGLLPTRIDERLAHQSDGVFFLRIEDTDQKRFVEGAEQNLIETYKYFNITFDEGAVAGGDSGAYGPYRQSQRKDIYQAFTIELIKKGTAYPCFCTEEELEQIRTEQETLGVDPGYYGKWAKWRDADIADIEAQLKAGVPFVIRFRCEGNAQNKIKFTDLVKGELELTENDKDHVLLKSDGIPTYHFAHAVDDQLMGTTHVVRDESWLPSLPFHLQLFKALGFKPPKFIHCSQLMKMEGDSKKKLSKRDKDASLADYKQKGYAPETITEYVMTLLNSNYEEWRTANPEKDFTEFPFSIKKMSPSGSLFDSDKLNDVSKNTISRMSSQKVYEGIVGWAEEFDGEFCALLKTDPAYAQEILNIGRGGKKPRKDLTFWSEAKDYMSFFYDALFTPDYNGLSVLNTDDAIGILSEYSNIYSEGCDQQSWFNQIRALSEKYGYAPDTKLYKENPESFKGHVGDVSSLIRVALTGRTSSPDMFEVMRIMGAKKVQSRIDKALKQLK